MVGERGTGRWRTAATAILAVLVFVGSPLAVVAIWADDLVSDTERYVATVAPLAADPALQSAVVDQVTDAIADGLDIRAVTEEAVDALASRGLSRQARADLSALAVPLAEGVRSFIADQVGGLVRSSAFEEAWAEANREAHGQLVRVLTGESSGAVEVTGSTVTLDVAVVVDTVKRRLEEEGFTLASRMPEVQARFTLVQSEDLRTAQSTFRLLDGLALALPLSVLCLLLATVGVCRSRRRGLLAASVAVVASMVVLGVIVRLFRRTYLEAVPEHALPADAAASVFDTIVRFLLDTAAGVAVVFLLVAFAAWATGPGAAATALRNDVRRGTAAVRRRTAASVIASPSRPPAPPAVPPKGHLP